MDSNLEEKRIGELFKLSVLLKGLHALIEIVGGTLLFLVPSSVFTHLVTLVTQKELLEDPHDLIATSLMHMGAQLSLNGKVFGSLYLLSHGLIKIVLVVALLKNKLWAYPWSLAALSLFIIYQVYRYTFTHSMGLILLTIFDLAVMWLIWKEYRIVKKHLSGTQFTNQG